VALAEIVAHKRVEVAARKAAVPHAVLVARATPADRDFFAALGTTAEGRRGGAARARYILECKRASPSRGAIASNLDSVALAKAYEPFADAISVLTDRRYFGGSFDDLATVRASCSRPVLCKDFVTEPYQVTEARVHGADAVLLMLSVLDDDTYIACRNEAARLNLGWLTEVHDEGELKRAIALYAPVIGINNRDLKTLAIDLATTERLAGLVPSDRVVISESGIASRNDVLRLAQHTNGYLIGSALSGSPDPARALRELIFGRVKVCGLTRARDAVAAWHAGATHGGVVLAESKRRVSIEQAAAVLDATPLSRVAVMVTAPLPDVSLAVRELRLDAVQLHGDEDANYVTRLCELLPEEVDLWIARRGPPFDDGAVRSAFHIPDGRGAHWLFDAHVAGGERGGTGHAYNRAVLAGRDDLGDLIVSGGLRPANVREAAQLGAWALDVSSGVESAPGIKDAALLEAIFDELRVVTATRRGA
jgi:indole-3-glycerol phosphate synthase/phosphoribosylanthranilate isomerase